MMSPLYPKARWLLHIIGLALLAGGLFNLFFPGIVSAALGLSAVTLAGTAEVRGLYGGGFFSFGVITLLGLHSVRFGSGLLLAMALFMGCVALARCVSMVIDAEYMFNLQAMAAELVFAVAAWIASSHGPVQKH